MYQTQQGPQMGYRPQQYAGTIGGYYPQQTDQWSGMFSMMMPMIMMIMMMAIMMPMLKGITGKS
jgi:hypothetical protein